MAEQTTTSFYLFSFSHYILNDVDTSNCKAMISMIKATCLFFSCTFHLIVYYHPSLDAESMNQILRHIFRLTAKLPSYIQSVGTAVAQWLRCCATNRKVAGSIPAGVIGIFH